MWKQKMTRMQHFSFIRFRALSIRVTRLITHEIKSTFGYMHGRIHLIEINKPFVYGRDLRYDHDMSCRG